MKTGFQKNIISPILIFISILILLRFVWVSDDAFITLRTVDNWTNGFGLTWNVSERVQTYTHPLWMLLISGIYIFIKDGYFTAIIASLFVSILVISIYIRQFSENPFLMVAGWGILMLSKAFLDYSSSGLENPLTHLLFIVFTIIVIGGKSNFFTVCLIAGLSMTNRMDSILFFVPTLAYLFLKKNLNTRSFLYLIVGFAPFILWELFSIFYYGFPFPNTAYAKLNTGISNAVLINQGFLYYLNSFKWDPITLLTITISIGLAITYGEVKTKLLSIGILLYEMYIIYIGGDFMSGRFFSAIFISASFILLKSIHLIRFRHQLLFIGILIFAGLFNYKNLQHFNTPLLNLQNQSPTQFIDDQSGISDERNYYFQASSIFYIDKSLKMPKHAWVDRGFAYQFESTPVVIEDTVGMMGFFAGPKTHFIDSNALGDPLLARLKMSTHDWRIGHFAREIPVGYYETILKKKNLIEDSSLSEYYEKLDFIISGQLFSRKRMLAIWEMNTGKYNYLLEEYYDHSP